MKNTFRKCSSPFAFLFFLAYATGYLGAQTPSTAKLVVQSEHKNGIYKVGEKINFKINVIKDGVKVKSGKIIYDLFVDCLKKSSGSVELVDGEAQVSSELSAPGTLILDANFTEEGKSIAGKLGVVADPFNIKPSLATPSDFAEFWTNQKKKLEKVPMNPKIVKVDPPEVVSWGSSVECYDVELDCIGGKSVHGYYVKPSNAKPKSLSAILSLHSAGVGNSSLRGAWIGGKSGKLSLDINAHGLPNGQPDKYYNDLANGELNGYLHKGIEDRGTFYLYGMFMRIVRAIDFLTSQPEWDGKILIATGGSQGGDKHLLREASMSEFRKFKPMFLPFAT